MQTLAARKEWAAALLDAVEKKDIPRADIPVTTARQILVRSMTRRCHCGSKVSGARSLPHPRAGRTHQEMEGILTEDTLAKASTANGRAMFTKHCAACHKMFGEKGRPSARTDRLAAIEPRLRAGKTCSRPECRRAA
ncbi:MAG: c-type cytochrome [Gemmataceae bacterium]